MNQTSLFQNLKTISNDKNLTYDRKTATIKKFTALNLQSCVLLIQYLKLGTFSEFNKFSFKAIFLPEELLVHKVLAQTCSHELNSRINSSQEVL